MSTVEQNEPTVCWSCKKNEATVPYMVAQGTTLVCPPCRDWLTARDALDRMLRDNTDLEEAGRVDEALQRLDAFVEAHAGQDHDLQFRRRITHHRAMALIDAERYVEAEATCIAWEQLGFANVWERWEHGFEMARTLKALNRHREALAVLEDAFSRENKHFFQRPKNSNCSWTFSTTSNSRSIRTGYNWRNPWQLLMVLNWKCINP